MTRSDNFRGILWMLMGMAGFATVDTMLKALAGGLPTGEILFLQGLGGVLVFGLMSRLSGGRDYWRRFFSPVILVRNLCELLAAAGFVIALASAPLSTVSAITQANPLLVTLGAAIWLREPVGRHRWVAILVGLLGVLLVIRPWGAGFEPAAMVAVGAVICLSARDLLTRRVARDIPTAQLGTFAMITLILGGPLVLWLEGSPLLVPDLRQALLLGLSIIALVFGIFGVTSAMRVGEVGAVTPFRYSRLPFALVFAAIVFGERPDGMTLIGGTVIVLAGLYAIWRENRRLRAVA